MKSVLLVALALAVSHALAGDPPAQANPPVGSEAQTGKAPNPVAAAPLPEGCVMNVGSSSRTLPAGYQTCWRHPEYLTCTKEGNWIPSFCPKGQLCNENGGKVGCIPLPEGTYEAQPIKVAPPPGAAPQNDRK